MDDTIRLKTDIQQMIALGNIEYNAHYGALLFEGEYKHLLQSICGFEKLTIKPYKDRLSFDIKLSKELIDSLSEEDLLKIKQCSWNTQMKDLMEQKEYENKNIYEQMMEEENAIEELNYAIEKAENSNKKYRKPTELEINNIELMKNILNKILKVNFKEKHTEDFLSLELELPKITLNNKQLNILYSIVMNFFDCFFICPVYQSELANIDNDKVIGVRLFLAIKLSEMI